MKKLVLLSSLLLVTFTAKADLVEDGQKLCAKIKSCAAVELNTQAGMSQEEKDAVLGIFDTQCLASVRKYESDLGSAGLEGKAHNCLVSLTEQSCETLLGGTGPVTTPVCTDFEKSAIEAGINLGQ